LLKHCSLSRHLVTLCLSIAAFWWRARTQVTGKPTYRSRGCLSC
jgi:hypothetical protein